MASVRPAAVAGMFYPGDPRTLAAEVDELLGGVDTLAPRLGYPKVLVVPHAGYIYSGPVAARAYDELAPARGIVKRVILLGPVHRVAVKGLALPAADYFDTPLGRIALEKPDLTDLPQVVRSDPAHAMEHSLEVQLPFLQKVLGEFSLVPFAVGMASVQDVAQVIERLWGGPETVVVISTDLSHYHNYDEARRIDRATIARIAGFATDVDHEEACGATPLNGLLHLGKQKNLSIKLLAANNSGDTAGGKGKVVGYSAFALHEGGEVSLESAGKRLLAIARGAIENQLLQKSSFNSLASALRGRGNIRVDWFDDRECSTNSFAATRLDQGQPTDVSPQSTPANVLAAAAHATLACAPVAAIAGHHPNGHHRRGDRAAVGGTVRDGLILGQLVVVRQPRLSIGFGGPLSRHVGLVLGRRAHCRRAARRQSRARAPTRPVKRSRRRGQRCPVAAVAGRTMGDIAGRRRRLPPRRDVCGGSMGALVAADQRRGVWHLRSHVRSRCRLLRLHAPCPR
jgi:hypothetical protein